MRAVGCEAMDDGVAVAVRDVDVAVRRDRDAGRVVEWRLKPRQVPRADGADLLAFGGEDQNLVRIPVDQQDAAVGRDGQAVRIGDPILAQCCMHAPVRVEDDDGRLGALIRVDPAACIDGDGADQPERSVSRCLPPRALHAVTPIAHDHHEITIEGHDVLQTFVNRTEAAGPGPSPTGPRLPAPDPRPSATLRFRLMTPCAPRRPARCGTPPPGRRKPGR